MRFDTSSSLTALTCSRRSVLVAAFSTGAALTVRTPRAAALATDTTRGAAYAEPDWLVDAAWLTKRAGDPKIRVVALMSPEDFASAHIAGAVQIDWSDLNLVDTSDPSIEHWRGGVEEILTSLGVSPSDTVVVYDSGTLVSARLWWILDQLSHVDKRVLNGGLGTWSAAGGKIETGATTSEVAAQPYFGWPNESNLANLDVVLAAIDDPDVILLDSRRADEYAAGHIPGAINVVHSTNALMEGSDLTRAAEEQRALHTGVNPAPVALWKSADDLRTMYEAAGVTPDKTVIAYCTTGVRSAVSYFSLRLIGYPNVRLYPGSLTEWAQHPELPVAKGEKP